MGTLTEESPCKYNQLFQGAVSTPSPLKKFVSAFPKSPHLPSLQPHCQLNIQQQCSNLCNIAPTQTQSQSQPLSHHRHVHHLSQLLSTSPVPVEENNEYEALGLASTSSSASPPSPSQTCIGTADALPVHEKVSNGLQSLASIEDARMDNGIIDGAGTAHTDYSSVSSDSDGYPRPRIRRDLLPHDFSDWKTPNISASSPDSKGTETSSVFETAKDKSVDVRVSETHQDAQGKCADVAKIYEDSCSSDLATKTLTAIHENGRKPEYKSSSVDGYGDGMLFDGGLGKMENESAVAEYKGRMFIGSDYGKTQTPTSKHEYDFCKDNGFCEEDIVKKRVFLDNSQDCELSVAGYGRRLFYDNSHVKLHMDKEPGVDGYGGKMHLDAGNDRKGAESPPRNVHDRRMPIGSHARNGCHTSTCRRMSIDSSGPKDHVSSMDRSNRRRSLEGYDKEIPWNESGRKRSENAQLLKELDGKDVYQNLAYMLPILGNLMESSEIKGQHGNLSNHSPPEFIAKKESLRTPRKRNALRNELKKILWQQLQAEDAASRPPASHLNLSAVVNLQDQVERLRQKLEASEETLDSYRTHLEARNNEAASEVAVLMKKVEELEKKVSEKELMWACAQDELTHKEDEIQHMKQLLEAADKSCSELKTRSAIYEEEVKSLRCEVAGLRWQIEIDAEMLMSHAEITTTEKLKETGSLLSDDDMQQRECDVSDMEDVSKMYQASLVVARHVPRDECLDLSCILRSKLQSFLFIPTFHVP